MGKTRDTRIAEALNVMEQRVAEPLRVQDLATAVNLSPSRFAHLFRASMGVPPLRYLHQLRMHRARELLTRTSLPVSDVMRLVGCPDPSHFSRDFRNEFGVGPRDYRREHGFAGPDSDATRVRISVDTQYEKEGG